MKIKHIRAQEILDSRGIPTVQCLLTLDNGYVVQASVPAGASVGSREACELRDKDPLRFNGKGVLKAVKNIELCLAPLVVGKEPDIVVMDELFIDADGTHDKHVLGANAILAVSIAVVRAQAYCRKMEVYALLADLFNIKKFGIPQCMFNVLNGGMHANNKILFQEFMVMPKQQDFFASMHCVVLIYQALKTLLSEADYLCTVGDEGGFAPVFQERGTLKERVALDFLMKAIEKAGYKAGEDVFICLDVAATHFYDADHKVYCFDNECFSSQDMIGVYERLIASYPICSIEDGMSEDDVEGWKLLTQQLGNKIQLVGDDIFVTNADTILQGKEQGLANAALIKPNQIGSVTEAYQAIVAAHSSGYVTVASHRSGETNDDFIADFSVGCGVAQLKAGAPARGERVAKYNRLLTIERALV